MNAHTVAGRTIFIWCNDTFATTRTTGIQRVVHSLVRHTAELAPEHGFAFSPVVMVDEKIADLAPGSLIEPDTRLAPAIRPVMISGGGLVNRLFDLKRWERIFRWYWVRGREVFSQRVLARTNSAALQRLPFLALADYPGARALRSIGRWFKPKTALQHPILKLIEKHEDMTGNILLMPEVRWNRRDWHPSRQFQEQGGKVITLVYDLIPILHQDPSYNAANLAHYEAWVELQVARSDGVIAISNTVAEEVRYYLTQHVPERAASLPISYFHLGSDFNASEQVTAELPADIAMLFDPSHHVFLMVGTIAPRKNHRFVLEAFDSYWDQGGTAHLAFVGYAAFGTDEFLHYLRAHPRNGTLLHHLTNINDAELETIYSRSAALIMASSAEGFGLPLVEAMQRGVPVLCSDIPIFHEVTAEQAEFFSLESVTYLAALVKDFETRYPPGQPIPRNPKKCLSWRESTQMLLHNMLELIKVGE